MEPQENSNAMQSSVPVNLEPKVEPVVPGKPEKKPSKMNGMIIGMVILVVCLVLGLTYYVLKDNGTDLLALGKQTDTTTGSETEDSSTTDSTTEEEGVDSTTTCEDTGTTNCEVNVDNKGWSLFSVPEYAFSVEVPTYIISQTLESQNIPSRWTAWFNTDPIYSDGHAWEYLLENKLGTAELTFYPARIPEGWGCGFGCTREHIIDVNMYKNNGAQNLGNVVSTYRTAWEAKYVNEDVLSGNLKGENVKKWGADVWSFDASREGGTWHGYLVVTNDYIYEVKYMFSDGISSAESLNIAQKVLDSMKFGE